MQLVGQRECIDDLSVRIALEVVVALGEKLLLELEVIGNLAVEREGEPLGLSPMIALEGLGVATVIAAAGGVSYVADRGGTVHALHDRLELIAMIETEGLGDGPDFLMSLQQGVAAPADSSSFLRAS